MKFLFIVGAILVTFISIIILLVINKDIFKK